MKAVLCVALDLFREASSRRWFLALGIGITLLLALAGLTLRIDVVDGALAATRLFGKVVHADIRSVDVALRPVFRAAAYFIFYGGLAFGILACALIGALYGAGGFTLLLAVKTGVWTLRPLLAALIASVTFAAIYGGMLVAALFARSAALSAATGGFLFLTGIVAGYRQRLDHFFEPGIGRWLFQAVTLVLPRVSTLADASADLAASAPIDRGALGSELVGLAVFGLAALAFGIWRFESQDF